MQRQFATTSPVQANPRKALSNRLRCGRFLEQTLRGCFLQGRAPTFHERGVFGGIRKKSDGISRPRAEAEFKIVIRKQPDPSRFFIGTHCFLPVSFSHRSAQRYHQSGLYMMRKILA